MILKKTFSENNISILLSDFISKYNDALDELDIDFLNGNWNKGLYFDIVPYLLNQFYNEYDLEDEEKNIYLALLKKIKEAFQLENRNIIEIGGGPIPTLSRMMTKETKKEVTVYDSNITLKNNNISNLNIVRRLFLPFTDLSKYDLAVSFMACGAQETIICNCAEYKKDFFIGLCPCGREAINEEYNINLSSGEYIDSIIELANKKTKEANLGELIIDKLDDKYCYPFPIIYNKRPKVMTYEKR